ncbi:chromosome partitioning protein ParB [Pseudooceanicola spongiae]|uniref:Chromosome partitioning protein ParB n=2 Tax=Pseudooceanicola spongiae TaxID=2613965 RepID=A0A7L9WLP2_9RHOB|nr:chromosome partitioning protein ParB [Pseudooceanicola spongiae]
MTKPMVLDVSIDLIDVPDDRARHYDDQSARALANVLNVQGLFHPIRVRQIGDRYRLITGLLRLRAFQINGAQSIPASLSDADTDDAERLEEVMENLARNDLIALDRCHHLYELKHAYERLHPETKAGVAGAKAKHGSANEIFSFAQVTAEHIGLSQRSIQVAVKIWTDLTSASRARLAGTPTARKQTELKALAELPPARQEQVLDLILDEDSAAGNVAGALEVLDQKPDNSRLEKVLAAVSSGLKSLPEDSFDRLIHENEDRVMASLKRRGRI